MKMRIKFTHEDKIHYSFYSLHCLSVFLAIFFWLKSECLCLKAVNRMLLQNPVEETSGTLAV